MSIESSREELYQYRIALHEARRINEDAHKRLFACFQDYRALYHQHTNVLADLNRATSSMTTMSGELEQANEIIIALELELNQNKVHGETTHEYTSDNENNALDQHAVAALKAKLSRLDDEILDMEIKQDKEKLEMIENYENALRNAADHIIACEHKIDQLERERQPDSPEKYSESGEQHDSPKRPRAGDEEQIEDLQLQLGAQSDRKRRQRKE